MLIEHCDLYWIEKATLNWTNDVQTFASNREDSEDLIRKVCNLYLHAMENAIEVEHKNNIELILKAFDNTDDISVECVDCSAGCKDGDNYMSVVKRIDVRGKCHGNQGEWPRYGGCWCE